MDVLINSLVTLVCETDSHTFPNTAHTMARQLAKSEGQRVFECLISELRAECSRMLSSPGECVLRIATSIQSSQSSGEVDAEPCFTRLQVDT